MPTTDTSEKGLESLIVAALVFFLGHGAALLLMGAALAWVIMISHIVESMKVWEIS